MLKLVDDDESAEGAEIVVDVLGNDTVAEASGGGEKSLAGVWGAGAYELSVDSPPAHGTAEVDGSSISYTPTAGYAGEDEFTYRVEQSSPGTVLGTAVVRITVAAPVVTPSPTPTPVPQPTPAPTRTKKVAPPAIYPNCDAARAAGAAPVRRGDVGYGSHLDRDGDGVGCEPYSGGGSGGSTSGSGSGGSGGGSSTYYANCSAARDAGAAPVRRGDPGYGRHLDRDGDGVGCEG
ncbi:excalibur calcium-binding domain-containing protein [Streptomyces sp. NPDC056463]|uniref:excalibur calcium-binding domain-containing protein n=1 Tax=Streptomyces sp. NPDC056463 TaxID=3345827 RepID=UPI0036833D5D